MGNPNNEAICYLITKSESGGAQAHVSELLNGLHSDYRLSLGTGQSGFLTEIAEQLGVETTLLPNLVRHMSLSAEVRAYLEINNYLRRSAPTLVHAHSSKAGMLGRFAATRRGIKSVFTAHGWAFAQGVPLHRKMVGIITERFAARFTEKIITVSGADATLARRYRIASDEKLITIHNGIPDSPYRALPDASDHVRIIMVARFSEQKDQATLLHAMTQLKGDYSLMLVGTGPRTEQARKLITNLKLNTKVDILGDRKDIPELLAASHIFVLSSNWEGLPISILEAMRAGLPVIATEVGGVNELVKHQVNGYLTSPQDATTLAEYTQRLIDNPRLRVKQGSAGRTRFELNFTVDKMLNRTEQLYQGILKN